MEKENRHLQPLSPNRAGQSDAWAQIRQLQDEVCQLLCRLEEQTAQTAVDLGQLVDRLKNNNQYLTKLLAGLLAHDGADKQDIDRVVAAIERQLADTQAAVQAAVARMEQLAVAKDHVTPGAAAAALEARTASLQLRYDELCAAYRAKYDELAALRSDFAALESAVQALHTDAEPLHLRKARYGNLKQLHASLASVGVDALAEKRVASTPTPK